MKKIFIIFISIIVTLVIGFFVLNTIIGRMELVGSSGISSNIIESKKRGVFIKEYTSSPNPYKINDTLQVTIKEAWLEYRWYYCDNLDEAGIYPGFQYHLCIRSTKQDICKYKPFDISIGISGDKYMRISSSSSLVGDFKSMPGDTIEYIVAKGRLQNNMDTIGIVLGKLVLIKI